MSTLPDSFQQAEMNVVTERTLKVVAAELESVEDLSAPLMELAIRLIDEGVEEELAAIAETFGRLTESQRKLPPAMWVRGVVRGRFGSDRYALPFLQEAREIFSERGMLFETALISLDLIYSHWRLGNEDEVRLEITHAVMRSRDLYTSTTLAALVFLRDIIIHDEVDDLAILSTRRAVATDDLSYLRGISRPLAKPLEAAR